MNKKEIVEVIREQTQLQKKDVEAIFDCLLGLIEKTLKEKGKIKFLKIGSLSVRQTKERNGVHPKTREPILIKPKFRVKFTQSNGLEI